MGGVAWSGRGEGGERWQGTARAGLEAGLRGMGRALRGSGKLRAGRWAKDAAGRGPLTLDLTGAGG